MAHGFRKMISMAKTPAEIDKELAPLNMPAPTRHDVAEFPYGLCISLCNDELDKLAIGEMPDIGDTIHLCCLCKVTSMSTSERADGAPQRRVELQITDMACESEDDENAAMSSEQRAAARYGGRKDDE